MLLILDTAAPHLRATLSPTDPTPPEPGVLRLPNDADPSRVLRDQTLESMVRIELHFPRFTDGRAFSQAFLIRRRLRFQGDLRATGDVLADQLLQMQRSGFTSAVLRADQDLQVARRQLARFAEAGGFYQGDAIAQRPRFQGANLQEDAA
jgi:uncharacterized protein (DUF934 family)